MTPITVIRRLTSFLRHRQEGVSLVVVGLTLGVLALSTGLAVDMARAQLLKTKLQQGCDAALLGAGATASTQNINEQANKFFNANFPAGYMGSTVSPVAVATSGGNSVLNLAVSAQMPTTFMRMVGTDNLNINVACEINRTTSSAKGLELALVLDNTGSMAFLGKMTTLKSAVNTMMNILFEGQPSTLPNTYISIIPFNTMANITAAHSNWLTTLPPRNWTGCAKHRPTAPTSDVPPTSAGGKFPPDDRVPISPNIIPEPCPAPMVPMLSSRSAIDAAVSAMQPVGSTRINVGMSWGWNVLSPKWRGLWVPALPNLPQNYDSDRLNKVALLMTDGVNAVNGSINTFPNDKIEMSTLCENMKAAGITIYTIAFQITDVVPAAAIKDVQDRLEKCASNPNYFFDAPDGPALIKAFKQIADSLLNLRISK